MNQIMTVGAVALEIDPNQSFSNFGDALSFALTSSLFGIAVVFGVLALLWGVLELFRVFFYKDSAKNTHKKEEAASVVPVTVSEASAPVEASTPISSDGELVAAITAAICAFRSASGTNGGFKVVSFKKR